MKTNLFIALLVGQISITGVHAASICDGLTKGVEDRIDKEPDSLAGVPQASNQTITSGHGVRSSEGNYFGSCATYTSIARFNAILKREGIPVPPEYLVNDKNIIRLYKKYGDGNGSGIGNAKIVTGNILTEFMQKYCSTSKSMELMLNDINELNDSNKNAAELCLDDIKSMACDKKRLTKYFEKKYPQKNKLSQGIRLETVNYSSKENYFKKIADQFKKPKPRIPLELVYTPAMLTLSATSKVPRGSGHVSLVTGRRMTASGKCEVLVRNSWKGRCVNGKYKYSNQPCDNATDSSWVGEERFYDGSTLVRYVP